MPAPGFSTLIDLIEGARDVPPDRGIRVVSSQFAESYYSYSEIFRRVMFHAGHLRAQDVEAGDKVVVPLATDIDVICSFLALIWIGATPVSVSGQMAGQERGAYLGQILGLRERFGFDRILTDRQLALDLADNGTLDPRITVDPTPPRLDPDRPAPPVPPARVAETDLAFLQFSSGSTGDPKGIQITHRNVCSNIKLIVENDGRSEHSSGVVWLPLTHDMGLVGGFLSCWAHRHPLVLMNPVCFLMRPVTWLDYISRYRGTVSPVPNFAIDMCNTRIRDHQLASRKPDLGSLEYIYDGSEPVSADAIERFTERFAPYGLRRDVIHPAYGMAEATLMISVPPKGSPLATRDADGVRVVSVGRPVGDTQVRIVDESERELPAETVGEIAVRGSCLTPGYYEDEEENRRRFRDGWFHTGDLGLLDADGRLFVTGRIKDLIIVDGRNCYAHDIAAKLEELPFVRRGKTHVFSYNVEGREEVIVMTVLASSMTPAVRGRMDEEMKATLLREFGLPIHDVMLVQRIPRTSSGKIRRGECEALYREYLESARPGQETLSGRPVDPGT